jgi:hypothetical protein
MGLGTGAARPPGEGVGATGARSVKVWCPWPGPNQDAGGERAAGAGKFRALNMTQ